VLEERLPVGRQVHHLALLAVRLLAHCHQRVLFGPALCEPPRAPARPGGWGVARVSTPCRRRHTGCRSCVLATGLRHEVHGPGTVVEGPPDKV